MLNATMNFAVGFLDTTSLNSTLLYSLKYPSNMLLRNFCLGIIGILTNALAVSFMLLNKKVKFPLKVTLAGLSFNDLTFSCTAVLYGISDWTWGSDEPQCWPIVYVVLSTIIVSHCLTCTLALHNAVAVFFPLKSKLIITDARSGVMVLATWVAGYTLVLACFGIDIPGGRPCIAVALIPRAGLGAMCAIALACIAFTIVVNMLIFIKLRNRRKVTDVVSTEFKMPGLGSSDRTLETELANKTVNESCGHSTSAESGQHAFQPYGDLLVTKPNQTHSSSNGRRLSVATISKFHLRTEGVVDDCNIEANSSRDSFSNQRPTTSCNLHPHYARQPKNLSFDLNSATRNSTRANVLGGDGFVSSSSKHIDLRSKQFLACCRPTPVARRCQKSRVKRTRNTLLMMTCFSCLLAFPLIVDGFYLTIWAPDLQQFSSSIFGLLVSSLNTAHALANPLVYIWRFVDWRKVVAEFKTRFQRRT